MKNNTNKPIFILGAIFVGIGLGLVAIAFVVMTNSSRFISETLLVEGVITNIETERYRSSNGTRTRHIVSVDYIVDGVKYENTVNHYRYTMRIGDGIPLYYIPDQPWRIKADPGNENLAGIFFIGFGGIFFIAGLGFLNSIRKKIMLQKYLKQHGKTIYAEVIAVERDTSVSVNGTHPYSFIKCAAKNTVTDEITATYNSWSIKNDYLLPYVGKQVKVYLHPADSKKYYVDLDDLLKN